MALLLHLFGEPSIEKDGEILCLPFKKAEALLYYLACEGSASKEKIKLMFWGGKNEKQAAANMRNALCLLRKSLPTELSADRKSVSLRDFTTDADMLRQAADPAKPIPVDLFKEPLGGLDMDSLPEFDEWLSGTRDRLKSGAADALRDRITACYDMRDDGAAAESLSALLSIDPYDEDALLELMEIYRNDGQASKAMQLYNSFSRRLRADMGMEPGLRAKEFALKLNSQAGAGAGAPGEFFCGREHEIKKILGLIQQNRKNLTLVLIHGEGGVGKTALVNRLLKLSGGTVLRASPVSIGGKFPYSSWSGIAAGMKEAYAAAGLRPDAGAVSALSSIFFEFSSDGATQNVLNAALSHEQGPAAVGRAFAALAGGLREGPISFVFEDLHWFDDRSLTTLEVFLSSLGVPAAVFLTSRPESAVQSANLLYGVKTALHSERLSVQLAPFSAQEIMRYCRSFLTEDVIAGRGEEYFIRASEGMPLLLAEMMRILTEDGGADCTDGLKGLIMGRLGGMTNIERELTLALSAFTGGASPDDLASVVSKPADEIAAPLESLLRKKMIQETDDGGSVSIDFLHANVRECLYDSLPSFRKSQLHAKIAEVLGAHYSPHVWNPALSAKLCHHYTMAGMKAQVLRQNLTEMMFHINLNHILFPMIEDVVLLKCSIPFSSREETEYKFSRIGEMLFRAEDSAPVSREEAASFEAAYFEMYGGYMINWGEYEKGLAMLDRACRLSEENGLDETYLHAMEDVAHFYLQTDDAAKLAEAGSGILSLAEKMGRENHAGLALRFLGMAKQIEGDFEEAEKIFNKSSKVFENLELLGRRYTLNMLAPLCYVGEMLQRRGETRGALEQFSRCIETCEKRGLFWGRSHFHAHAADACLDMDDWDALYRHIRLGASLFESSKGGHCTSLLYSLKAICDAEEGLAEEALISLKKADFLSSIGKKSWHAAQYMAQAWTASLIKKGRLGAEPFKGYFKEPPERYAELAASLYSEIGAEGRSRFIAGRFL